MNVGENSSEAVPSPLSLNAPNDRDVALLDIVRESRSASVAVTVKLSTEFSATVCGPILARIGAWLVLVTFRMNISSSKSIPSVTLTLI